MFADRLKTRFYQGLPLEINPPDKDLKIKILKNKVIGLESAELLTDDIFEYIAANTPADVRSLEGTINRLFANIAMLKPEVISIEFVKQALGDIFGSNLYMTNDLARIRKTVAEYYDVTEDSLKSKKRQANINKARQVAMYISSIITEETVEKIGQHYNRDHATVLHSCEKIKNDLTDDEQLQKEIKELRDKLTE
jgi:chromosomal replication initiator protein